jgi:hypothetical protein
MVLLAGLLAGVSVRAADINSDAGTSAYPFLKIGVGARPIAMGGAFTGLADDESALYYNPAGIAMLEGTHYMLEYHSYFVDMQSGFIAMTHQLDQTKTLGAYINYLNYGDMTETDNLGNVLGKFSGGDWLFGLTFAVRPQYQYELGVTAKLIYEKIQDFSSAGMAFDLGARYSSNRGRYSAGVMVQNLGFQLSTLGTGDKEKLPLTFRAGGAARFRGIPIQFAADVIKPIDNDVYIALGGEYFEFKPLLLRVGWNSFGSNYRVTGSDDSWAGLSVGVGFDIKDLGFMKNAQISYSYSPAADLGEIHRITLTGGR